MTRKLRALKIRVQKEIVIKCYRLKNRPIRKYLFGEELPKIGLVTNDICLFKVMKKRLRVNLEKEEINKHNIQSLSNLFKISSLSKVGCYLLPNRSKSRILSYRRRRLISEKRTRNELILWKLLEIFSKARICYSFVMSCILNKNRLISLLTYQNGNSDLRVLDFRQRQC